MTEILLEDLHNTVITVPFITAMQHTHPPVSVSRVDYGFMRVPCHCSNRHCCPVKTGSTLIPTVAAVRVTGSVLSCRCCRINCRSCRGVTLPGNNWPVLGCCDSIPTFGRWFWYAFPFDLTQWCVLSVHVSTLAYRCFFHRTLNSVF